MALSTPSLVEARGVGADGVDGVFGAEQLGRQRRHGQVGIPGLADLGEPGDDVGVQAAVAVGRAVEGEGGVLGLQVREVRQDRVLAHQRLGRRARVPEPTVTNGLALRGGIGVARGRGHAERLEVDGVAEKGHQQGAVVDYDDVGLQRLDVLADRLL